MTKEKERYNFEVRGSRLGTEFMRGVHNIQSFLGLDCNLDVSIFVIPPEGLPFRSCVLIKKYSQFVFPVNVVFASR